MKNKPNKKILVIGTGTVGAELIKRLAVLKCSGSRYFDWEEIIFHKKNPLEKDVNKITNLREINGPVFNKPLLCVDSDKKDDFIRIGLSPDYTLEEALERSDVVIDATPSGGENKNLYEKYQDKIFIAEGSEFKKKKKFGPIFIGGINEKFVLSRLKEGERFFVVGSCNAHTIARNIKIVLSTFSWLLPQNIVIEVSVLRRSDDPNKEKTSTAFSFSKPDEEYLKEGSYHAYNVLEAFKSIGWEGLNINTVVAKLADPFMHCLLWKVSIPGFAPNAKELFLKRISEDIFCSVTSYMQANVVYSEAKEIKRFSFDPRFDPRFIYPWFIKDRLYSHTVVCLPTINVRHSEKHTILEYGTFTPQDSNIIWSNLKMAAMAKDPEGFYNYEFDEFTSPLFIPRGI